jgi:tripartite ATP-independent transporter DctP family solute receptor
MMKKPVFYFLSFIKKNKGGIQMFRKVLAVTLILTMAVLVFAGCAPKAEAPASGAPVEEVKPVTLKMSVTTADGSTWTMGAQKFADLVKEKTGGKVEVKVYPNEQLSGGNQGKGVEMLSSGAIDLSFHSNIIYSIMDEKFGVISLPWLLPDYETVDEKLAGSGGEAINKLLLEKGVVGLGFGENGFRQLTNSRREVKTVADMNGLKIRIPGIKMYIALYKALGANPTAMNFSEVFTSLQQKAIDGQENPLDVISSSKLYEVQKYMSVWNYSYDSIILGINKEKFESFSPEIQKAMQEAATEACKYQVSLNREKADAQLQDFKDRGMVVYEFTNDDMKPFIEAVQPVYDEYEGIMGKELIDSFR